MGSSEQLPVVLQTPLAEDWWQWAAEIAENQGEMSGGDHRGSPKLLSVFLCKELRGSQFFSQGPGFPV